MAPNGVNRLLGFISTNLKKTKRKSKRLSSRFAVVGKDDEFEKENLNLSRSKSLSPKEQQKKTTTKKKRARDDARWCAKCENT